MFILKILFAPLSLILSLFVWLCAGLDVYKRQGFKKSTYKKAKKKAGVHSVKDGFAWYWTLPEVEKPKEGWQGENLPT